MRIISGKARRIQLKCITGRDIRPTGDRVKETLFSMLGPLDGLRVLDLFAGTGALGLEALSRGAAQVVLVERERRHAEVLKENLAVVAKAMGGVPEEAVRIVSCDVRSFHKRIPELAGTFDIILADPPYATAEGDYGGPELLRDAEFAAWAGPRALLMLEHDAESLPPWAPLSHWRFIKNRQIGNTTLSFCKLQDTP
jgi:16S rRNA (guanine966-N2)-methyltransferase